MKFVIIGNGAAGISAAEKLRQLDDSSEITIVSHEDMPVYTKFMLPDYIGDKIARNKLILRDISYYDKNRIKLLLSEKIENILSLDLKLVVSFSESFLKISLKKQKMNYHLQKKS